MKRDETGKFTQAWNGEPKQAVKLSLTKTAWKLLDQQAQEFGISRSEVIERYARHPHCPCCAETQINLTNGAMFDCSSTSIFQDIRERKQIEEQLQKSQHFIQQVADATPGILYIYDLIDQCNVYVNRQIGEVLGYTSDEIQAMGSLLFPTLMHPDDLATLSAHIQRFDRAQDGEMIEREYRMRHADGEWCWLWSRDLIFSRTATGSPHQVLGISHDITDRKQAQLSLQQTEERLQLALSSTQMVAWDLDIQTQQVVCSPDPLDLWGISVRTVDEFFANVHPQDRDQLIQALERAIAGEDYPPQEYRLLNSNRTVRWLSTQGRVYFDPEGRATRMVGVSVDISDRKQAISRLFLLSR